MKKLTKNLLILTGWIITLLTFSCDIQEKDALEQQLVKFSFEAPNLSAPNERRQPNMEQVAAVIVSIKDANDKTVVTAKKLSLFNFNGSYISEPLMLKPGNYFLYEFMVLGRNNKVKYASPMEGSAKSYLVMQPLEIAIKVDKNTVEQIIPEVLSITDATPEDFGYASFSFDPIDTFEFPIAVFVQGNDKEDPVPATAQISIYDRSQKFSYSTELIAETNWLNLPEHYNNYSLKIQKTGFQDFLQTFKSSALQDDYDKHNPLIIILKPEEDQLVFWNKLGSDEEVLNSEVGPNLELFYDENILINREYVPGVEGNAVTMTSYDFDTPIFLSVPNLVLNNLPSIIDPERGTIECYYFQTGIASFDSGDSNHIFDGRLGLGSGMGFENWGTGDQPDDGDINYAYSQLEFYLEFGGNRVAISVPNFDYNPDNRDKWIHLVVVWDRSGIDGSGETIQLYINGEKAAATSEAGWGTKVGEQADIAGGTSDWWDRKKPFYIDELKIYNYAKTDF
ncbi:LamG domain-containing protein [Echinicola shivajiensis]|uniref:LamG domain-containing protein n=1 Tax=Echinicola shivajiensis TaxID=1035916 RepID=UPI001BFBFA13|nr:LamG domain-containing protein [Echinicola shivajiensis]